MEELMKELEIALNKKHKFKPRINSKKTIIVY